MSQITLTLPDAVTDELVKASRRVHRDPAELGIDLLQGALLVSDFDRLRDATSAALRPDAPKNEDEAFEQIS